MIVKQLVFVLVGIPLLYVVVHAVAFWIIRKQIERREREATRGTGGEER